MEFNIGMLEEIIMGRASADDPEQMDGAEEQEVSRSYESSVPLSHTPPVIRKEVNGKSSMRLNSSQVADLKTASVSMTPRTSSVNLSSSGQTPRMTNTPRGASTPRAGTLPAEDLKAKKPKTLFDELSTKQGLENAVRWFEAHCSTNDRELSEAQFMSFLQSLSNFYDWEVYEILDILDRRHTNSVTWEAFYILLSLYTAYYSKRLTKFLFKHGLMVYQFLLDPVTKRLTFERFARLGFLVGLSEDDILETCLVFGFKKMTIEMVGQEDFQLFYFAIFNTIDTGVDLLKDNQSLGSSAPTGKVTSSPSGPNIKVHNIPSGSPTMANNTAAANAKCIIS